MSPIFYLIIVACYFGVLLLISYFTSKGADNQTFFNGNKKSPWFVVAIGMIGASLSGVTFISVPGWVCGTQFFYMQMVFGYLLGYIFIVFVLLPIYYKLNLTSIYTYLEKRFGMISYKTGSSLFLISRIIGASFRLFLVANVFQIAVFKDFKVPFVITVLITLALIWVYTFKGGIKTIVWTDTLQTIFMLTAVVLAFISISSSMNLSVSDAFQVVRESDYGHIFDFTGWRSETYFWKYFISGAFITIVMTGLDQDMMQKNLSCKNLSDAKKNILFYSIAFVPVNLIFMALGALLFIFSANNGISFPEASDNVFPILATQGHLPAYVGVFFLLGLIAAAYSSADSALTSLTTSFLIDIVGLKGRSEEELKKKRILTHLMMTIILAIVILIFKAINDDNVVKALFKAAGYTYGPLLGLFAFGIITRRKLYEKVVPIIALTSPAILFVLSFFSKKLFDGYIMGFEVLIFNGLLTFILLFAFSKAPDSIEKY